MRRWGDETIEARKFRRRARSKIGEQDAAFLDHRVCLLPDVGVHAAAFRLRRAFQALTVDIEQPAMEGAAQAAVLQPAEGEIGAAMRTGALDQAIAAALVAEQDEILP